MSDQKFDALLEKYRKYMLNFKDAAERSYSPEQAACYTRYAKRMAVMITQLKKAA